MSVLAPPDPVETVTATTGWPRTPAEQLRLRVWEALASGGLDSAALRRRIRHGHAAAEPIAAELVDLLEARAVPESDLDFSLLSSVPAMAAFGCLVADFAYARAAATDRWKPDVARGMSVFIVASALFDHVCDRQPELLPVIEETVTAAWMQAAFSGEAPGDPLADVAAPTLVAYLGVLGAEAARLWSRLTSDSRGSRTAALHAGLWERLAAAYEAQVASVPEAAKGVAASRDVGIVWSAPFSTALDVVAATSDAAPGLEIQTLLPEATRIGQLLSLVDDIADVEEDWRWGSANQYLDRAGIERRGRAVGAAPWPTLLSDGVLEPYLGDVVTLLDSLSNEERASLVAWLVYWLGT